MGLYKYLVNKWQAEGMPAELKQSRLIAWRRESATTRIKHPTRLDRARALGYCAKPGFFVVRQRVDMGSHRRPDWSGGRHSHNMGARLNLHKNYQAIAEERANNAYPNCEVLNSYYVAQDGKHYWYEVILADRSHPVVLADKPWLGVTHGRVYRGITSAGRKHRGLRRKGKGVEKARPSRRAHSRSL